jgi:hypothetical protein
MPSPSTSFDDNLDYCGELDRLSHHISDPSCVFAPGDELDVLLRDVPLPARYLQRLRQWVLDETHAA